MWTLWDHSSYAPDKRVKMHLLILWPWPLTFQLPNYVTSRISQDYSLYQVWTPWDDSFLSYAPRQKTERRTRTSYYTPTDRVSLSVIIIYSNICKKIVKTFVKLDTMPASMWIAIAIIGNRQIGKLAVVLYWQNTDALGLCGKIGFQTHWSEIVKFSYSTCNELGCPAVGISPRCLIVEVVIGLPGGETVWWYV